ncbi:MAG: hypothetical protein IJQ02_11095 [Oscillospiraceae bacterium]|nr:hypothetical protein [Lachnospiraceae bacterium]MBR0161811.1 hypothetical protein [Oscillospiraceae bacterium]
MLKRTVILLIMVLMCIVMSGCTGFYASDDFHKYWLKQNHEAFEQEIHNFSSSVTDKDLRNLEKRFEKSGLSNIYYDQNTETYKLYYQGSYEGIEMTRYLIHSLSEEVSISDCIYVLQHDGDPWYIDSDDGARQVWKGGGCDGQGYVIIDKVMDHWYYIELYYPT